MDEDIRELHAKLLRLAETDKSSPDKWFCGQKPDYRKLARNLERDLMSDRNWMTDRNWNDILRLLEVDTQNVRTDADWDEAKIKAIEATVIAIIEKLKDRDGEL